MGLFRNPEIRKITWLYGILSTGASILAFSWEIKFGLFTVLLCAVFMGIYYGGIFWRYRHIASLASDIDKLLHEDTQNLKLDQYREGELGILQSEIHKMTIRLRSQQQQLLNDKVYLADSIADISHQIRTPLTSINLLVQFLSKPDLTEERKSQLVRELYELLSRIDWLITTLLKISKLDAGTVDFAADTICLSDFLQKAVAAVLVPMELREQTLSIQAEGRISCDISWTCEALTNIIKNCMEHTPDGGAIRIYAMDNALYTEIIISDSGSGIPKEDLPHIFERFYKGKNSSDKSFGIGLALARMIITKQNGTIKAENSPHGGALFTIRFYKGTV